MILNFKGLAHSRCTILTFRLLKSVEPNRLCQSAWNVDSGRRHDRGRGHSERIWLSGTDIFIDQIDDRSPAGSRRRPRGFRMYDGDSRWNHPTDHQPGAPRS